MKNKKYLIILLALLALVCVIALVACKEKEEEQNDPVLSDYDMSGVSFSGQTVIYDGDAHTIAITGNLPGGVTVSYNYYKGEISSANKIDYEPVNAGVYKVVASFSGDENHNEIEDMYATLTIAKAELEVVVGAVGVADGSETQLDEPISFTQDDNGNFVHMWDGITYSIDIVSSNVPVEALDYSFYNKLDGNGLVDTSAYADWKLERVGDVRYMVVTIVDDEYLANYNAALVATVTVVKRTVEISTAEDLLVLADYADLSTNTRLNTRYVLTNDIDLGGAVWKTIRTVIPGDRANVGFCGELDGQGYTIHNFVINEKSVEEDNANAEHGIAFGFFGYLTDAYIHDINFADITVDLSLFKLESRGYAGDHLVNRLHFGILAGRIDPSVSGMGTTFENITVTNLKAYIEGFKGGFATFVGMDYAGGTRTNLDASNVEFYVLKMDNTASQLFNLGGLVGDLSTYTTGYALSTYENCDLENITLIAGKGLLTGSTSYVTIGGFAGYSSQATADTFTNCSISNFNFENWASARVGVFIGFNSLHSLGDNTARNDNDDDFGVFVVEVDGDVITKKAVDWKATE